MKTIIFILFMFLISSCRPASDFNYYISDAQRGNVWILKTWENNEYLYTNNQLKFENDGTCSTFISENENRMGTATSINVDTRNMENSTWEYEPTDSTFRILGSYDYKVISYSKDSILMLGNGYEGKFLLVRMK